MLPSLSSNPTTSPPSNAAGTRPGQAAGAPLRVAVVVALHAAYKVLISPLFTGSCRFEPSCADYTRDAVIAHGIVKGSWLGLRRLGRCHPLGGHGVDPVPPAIRSSRHS
jgi:uncharacterized protein